MSAIISQHGKYCKAIRPSKPDPGQFSTGYSAQYEPSDAILKAMNLAFIILM
jgi:hypothetical protein